MIFRCAFRTVSLLLVTVPLVATLSAQSAQRLSVQLSGIFARLQGTAYTNLGPGGGV